MQSLHLVGTCSHVLSPLHSTVLQVVTEYEDGEIDTVLEVTERMHAHLTCAVVSNDPIFTNHVLANTVNGTTYAGLRARCTGGLVGENSFRHQGRVSEGNAGTRDCQPYMCTL